jgi:hypothetical protein
VTETEGTDCTPAHCSYGAGHACDAVTRHPDAFPPGGGWQYAWRHPQYPIQHNY